LSPTHSILDFPALSVSAALSVISGGSNFSR